MTTSSGPSITLRCATDQNNTASTLTLTVERKTPRWGCFALKNDALASGTRTFQGFHDHETLPADTGTCHEIA